MQPEPKLLPAHPRPPRARQDPLLVRWGLVLLAVGTLVVLVIVPVANVFYQALREDYPRMQALARPGFAAGPCLLKDTMQLGAFNHGSFVLGQAAMMINEGLPYQVVQNLKRGYPLSEMTVGLLGMAFKPNSEEIDAIGAARSSSGQSLQREGIAGVVNELLIQLQSFDQPPGRASPVVLLPRVRPAGTEDQGQEHPGRPGPGGHGRARGRVDGIALRVDPPGRMAQRGGVRPVHEGRGPAGRARRENPVSAPMRV